VYWPLSHLAFWLQHLNKNTVDSVRLNYKHLQHYELTNMILFYNTRTSHVNHDSTSSILAAYERTTKAAIYTVLEVGNSQHPSVELADSINSRGLQIRHFKNDSCQVINFFNCNNHRAINFFNRELVVPLMHILFITFFSLFVFHLQTDITRRPIAVVC